MTIGVREKLLLGIDECRGGGGCRTPSDVPGLRRIAKILLVRDSHHRVNTGKQRGGGGVIERERMRDRGRE